MRATVTLRRRVPWGDIDASTVRDLYDDHAALLDAGDFDGWLELFAEDATYSVIAASSSS